MRELARSLWRFMSKPRGLFMMSAPDVEERRLLCDLKVARCSESALEAAAARGEQVGDELSDAKTRIADLAAHLPRGHTNAFCVFCVIYVLSLTVLVATYGEWHGQIQEMWGDLDNPYLLEYRYHESRLAKVGFFLRTSLWTGMGLLVLPVAVWFAQRKLERRHAHTLAALTAGLVLATSFVFFIALFSMFIGPLMIAMD